MCGIVAYIGKNNNPLIGLEALKRLEYRGYDSAGMAVYDSQKENIFTLKAVGKIVNLEKKLSQTNLPQGSPFLFYTRWATHGKVSEKNCHPHTDCQKNIYIIHNGIIENYQPLKEKLIEKGHKFTSETDSEVLAHLIEHFFKNNLEEAVRKALSYVKGTYALAVISKKDPDKLILARNSAPLLIGLAENEYLAASDPSAVITHTKKVIYLDDKEMAVLSKSQFFIENLNRDKIEKKVHQIDWDIEEAQKGGYSYFMLKEIMEQPQSIANSLRGRLVFDFGTAKLGGVETVKEKLKKIEGIKIIACGTSYYSGLIGKYMLEEYAGIPTEVDFASEFRYRKPVIKKNTAVIFISQSGETADTLAALKEVKEKKIELALGIVNVVGSSIARETNAGIYNHAGPEIGVASTKAFTSQLAVLALLTLFLGRQREISLVMGQRIVKELLKMPKIVEKVLAESSQIELLAKKYKDCPNFLFIGRKYNYPVALEGALKLKEISYLQAHAYPAGEMKHGPIALIDKDFPVLALVPSDSVYQKVISNIEEIKARKGKILAIASEGNKKIKNIADDVFYIPKTLEMLTPIISIIPLQLFAYYVSVLNGQDPDYPRNLAKSVTVE